MKYLKQRSSSKKDNTKPTLCREILDKDELFAHRELRLLQGQMKTTGSVLALTWAVIFHPMVTIFYYSWPSG